MNHAQIRKHAEEICRVSAEKSRLLREEHRVSQGDVKAGVIVLSLNSLFAILGLFFHTPVLAWIGVSCFCLVGALLWRKLNILDRHAYAAGYADGVHHEVVLWNEAINKTLPLGVEYPSEHTRSDG